MDSPVITYPNLDAISLKSYRFILIHLAELSALQLT